MDANQANKTDFAWSTLMQFAAQHSDEALQLLLAAFKTEAEKVGDRDEAKLLLATTWAAAFTTTRAEMQQGLAGMNTAERDTVSAAEILRRTGADAGKVLSMIARASVPEAEFGSEH